MPESETTDFHQRLRELEAKYAKAQRYRDKWAAKAAALEEKLGAFRLVLEDLGLSKDTASGQAGSADGLTAAVRAAVEKLEPGAVVTVDDLRPSLDEFSTSPTSPITKALVRMTEEDEPLIAIKEIGTGKRQSRYVVLGQNPDAVKTNQEEESERNVVRARFSGE